MRASALILAVAACVASAQTPPSAQRARPAPPRSAAPVPAGAQAPAAARPDPASASPPRFTPVEPGSRDVSPLNTSLRRLDLNLRVPTGFDRVYAVTPQPGVGVAIGADGGVLLGGTSLSDVGVRWFARMSGGLIALFPRSTFTQTPEGLMTDVPPGTLYFLGTPSAQALARATREPFAPTGTSATPRSRMDLSARRPAGGPDQPVAPESLLDDPAYRRHRLLELLSDAQRAPHLRREPSSRR